MVTGKRYLVTLYLQSESSEWAGSELGHHFKTQSNYSLYLTRFHLLIVLQSSKTAGDHLQIHEPMGDISLLNHKYRVHFPQNILFPLP